MTSSAPLSAGLPISLTALSIVRWVIKVVATNQIFLHREDHASAVFPFGNYRPTEEDLPEQEK
jgi:hypothetical protein